MTRRKTKQEVLDIIHSVGLKVVGDFKYKDALTKMKLSDSNGYLYSLSLGNIAISKRNSLTRFWPVSKVNPHSIKNIVRFIEINSIKARLLSKEFLGAKKKLVFECLECESTYTRGWTNFTINNNCPICEAMKPSQKRLSLDEINARCEENGISLVNPEIWKGVDELRWGECQECSHVWQFRFHNVGRHGCPKCNRSKGEMRVSDFLDSFQIEYIPQKRFKNCRDKKTLPFDFYIPCMNVCIEYDGEMHFEAPRFLSPKDGEKKLKDTKKKDEIKTRFCRDSGIRLIRIPHWDFDNIEKILEKELKL